MDLDLVHAQWRLGLFPPQQVPEFAAQAMMQGFEGPCILELASFHRPTRWDIKPEVFDGALREMGRLPMGEGEAALILARVVAARMLRDQVSPERGAEEIRDLISRSGYPDSPRPLLDFQYGLYGLEDSPCPRKEKSQRLIEMAWDLICVEPGR